MTFRIRSAEDNLYDSAEKVYREHLKKYSKWNNMHLWHYFYYDFFHNGRIGDITFRNGADSLMVEITCPNIKRRIGREDEDFEYITVDFICEFSDVSHFRFAREDTAVEPGKRGAGPFTYLYSEINSMSEHIAAQKSPGLDNYQSLIIQVMAAEGASGPSYIEIVFADIRVEAIERAAFQLMLASPDFEVPLYSENE